MKFKTHNQDIIDASGTHFLGTISISYYELLKRFGEPTDGDYYTMDASWSIRFEDGTVATIYNYKNGKNYNGPVGIPVEEIYNWNIGGHEPKALDYIIDLLMNKPILAVA